MQSQPAHSTHKIIGRRAELDQLMRIAESNASAIVVVYGRRRVGKTTLVEHAYRQRNILKIEGVEGGDKAKQIETALLMLQSYIGDPVIARLQFDRWLEFFQYLARYISTGQHTLYLEELQWLCCYDDEFISDFKIAWDNYFKQNSQLIVVLCGSSPSFMVSRVIKSKALYGRSQHQLHVKPFSLDECRAYFGPDFSDSAVMDAYLSVGGIPEYLAYLRRSKSPYIELCREAFTANGYFFNECERIFVSSLANNPHYRQVLELLANSRFLTRSEIANHLNIEAGGTLSALLSELEASGFINHYVPYNKTPSSKLVRYEIADQYLQFYYRFVAPQYKKISSGMFQDNPTKALNLTDYQQWLGYSFERWCRAHHHALAKRLGFSAVNYEVGPFFSRATPGNFQIDLIFRRADRVITIAEIKYSRTPTPKSVVQEFERKMTLFDVPPRHSIERVLISISGCDQSVIDAGYFDDILTLKDIMPDA